jgi:hypothetical protein
MGGCLEASWQGSCGLICALMAADRLGQAGVAGASVHVVIPAVNDAPVPEKVA